jgi:ribosomal protection tetracycline resistance protein
MFPSSSAAVDAPVAGQVFKVERTSRGHRVCSVRLRAGMLAVREHVVVGHDRHGTVTALEVHQPGGAVQTVQAYAGQIARVRGLEQARVGDWIGARSSEAAQLSFPAPAMESTITAVDPRQQNELFSALVELTDVDPLIGLQTRRDELSVSLYGAVQQEVIAETLSAEYGIDVRFGPPTVICLERLTGPGQAVLRIGDTQHLYAVTMGVTVEPMAPGHGVDVQITAESSGVPLHVYGNIDGFRRAVLGYLREPLSSGPRGWRLTDVRVTVTESGYSPAGPPAADVRHTTALVVAAAVRAAGTVVCEPVDRIRVEFPAEAMSSVFGVLGRHGVVPEAPTIEGGFAVVYGTVRTAAVDAVRRGLQGVAQGQAVFAALRITSRRPAPVKEQPADEPLRRNSCAYSPRALRLFLG